MKSVLVCLTLTILSAGISFEGNDTALNKLTTCPETVSSPLPISLPPLECWALERSCYCFSPAVDLIENGEKESHIELVADWFEANDICHSLQMSLVAIESRRENDLINDLIFNQEVLLKLYWTKGHFNSKSGTFVWPIIISVDNVTIKTKEGSPSFNYTNWAPGHPSTVSNTKGGVLLSCPHYQQKPCKWEFHNFNVPAGVMCEAPLDPAYKPLNVTRKAKMKEYALPTPVDDHQQEDNNTSKFVMKKCPEVALLPLYYFIPSLECWAFQANHHCYCFSPIALIVGMDKTQPKEPSPTVLTIGWESAFWVCNYLGMKMVSIETREENEMISKHISSQKALGPIFWTSGFYTTDFIWVKKISDEKPSKMNGTLFNYTNWGKGYPLANKLINNAVTLSCKNGSSCDWRNQPVTERSGVLCEEDLDPSYKIPNVTRQAEIRGFSPPAVHGEGKENGSGDYQMDIPSTQKTLSKQSNSNILQPFIAVPAIILLTLCV